MLLFLVCGLVFCFLVKLFREIVSIAKYIVLTVCKFSIVLFCKKHDVDFDEWNSLKVPGDLPNDAMISTGQKRENDNAPCKGNIYDFLKGGKGR